MKRNKIIYKLVAEDIQNVAEEKLERNLTDDEINNILDSIAEKINWYDAIYNSISEKIE
jgi:hypothetical protein